MLLLEMHCIGLLCFPVVNGVGLIFLITLDHVGIANVLVGFCFIFILKLDESTVLTRIHLYSTPYLQS